MNRRDKQLADRIEKASHVLAEVSGKLHEAEDRLGIAEDYGRAKKQLADLQALLDNTKEGHARELRETEHKLGLHRKQIESERTIMKAEAEAERFRAVEEAKLAIREGNLEAERTRFDQEIAFRTQRFEEEAKTLRDLTGQILERLPVVNVERSFQTVEHVGNTPPAITKGD